MTNFSFKGSDSWFCEEEGLASGASIAETLAIWMKSFKYHIKSTKEIAKNDLEACSEINRRVTYKAKESNVKIMRIGAMQNDKKLIINFRLK